MPKTPAVFFVPGSCQRWRMVLALPVAFMMVFALFAPNPVAAHAEVVRSNPPADGILTAPPATIQLWTSEAVASGAGSPEVHVLDESGNPVPVSDVHVDPNDARHIVANLDRAGYGTFTVMWTTRSQTDGHMLSGTFGYRVGGSDRAPGAATVEGQRPRIWAVATRWLTFLAAAIAAAGFLIAPFVLEPSGMTDLRARRMRVIAAVSMIGVVATLLEPVLQAAFPPAGAIEPSLRDAIRGLPAAWWLRVPALAVALVLALILMVRSRRGDTYLVWIGGAAGLTAMLGLALTSHASARENWRALATASVVLHQWAVGLWAGGLVHLLFSRPYTRTGEKPLPIQRFSFWALFLALIGITTGVINAGLVLPTLASLWKSDYGRVLLVKVGVLVPVLTLATYHRVTLRRAVERAASAFRLSLRVEAVLIAVVILGGSTLALLAPPTEAKGTTTEVDLAAPLSSNGSADDNRYVLFHIDPAHQGVNNLGVQVTDGPPLYLDETGKLARSQPQMDIALVRVSFTNLVQANVPVQIPLTADGATGWFRTKTNQLGLGGWWQADVLVRRLGVEDVTVSFYFILPDPNVAGFAAVKNPRSSPEAKAVFDRAFGAMSAWTSIHFTERLNGGTGTVSLSEQTTVAGGNGQPAALRIQTKDSELVHIGGLQWYREGNGEWTKTDAPPVVPPSQWGTDYQGGTAFQLGATDVINGRPAQIVMFYVPSETYAPAWYAWWVDTETGNLLQQAMISRGHYMLRDFSQFDSAAAITAPTP